MAALEFKLGLDRAHCTCALCDSHQFTIELTKTLSAGWPGWLKPMLGQIEGLKNMPGQTRNEFLNWRASDHTASCHRKRGMLFVHTRTWSREVWVCPKHVYLSHITVKENRLLSSPSSPDSLFFPSVALNTCRNIALGMLSQMLLLTCLSAIFCLRMFS